MDFFSRWIPALVCLASVYQVHTSLLVPILELDRSIMDGELADLTCTLPYNGTLQVDLSIKGNETFTDCVRYMGPPPKLVCTLDVTKKFHGMEVICEARFVTKSIPSTIYVQTEPKITDCPRSVTWVEGQVTSFHCKAEGYTIPVVHCSKPNNTYKEGETFNVTRNMSGIYTCRAKNSVDTVMKVISVTVEYKPRILNMEVLPPSPVPIGENVTVTCEAEGFPSPTYSWITPTSDIQFSPDNRTITIRMMKAEHVGIYTCTVQNRHGTDSRGELIVTPEKPRILNVEVLPPSPVSEGTNITLTCVADGVPFPTYSWETPTSDIMLSTDNRTVTIQGAKQSHAGKYTCKAQNKYGTDSREETIDVPGTSGLGRGSMSEPVYCTIVFMLIPTSLIYYLH
ncbi:intercellular adhesion molecule 5-like [Rhinophrynus dorsalis]